VILWSVEVWEPILSESETSPEMPRVFLVQEEGSPGRMLTGPVGRLCLPVELVAWKA
jgi:hypothetical protein